MIVVDEGLRAALMERYARELSGRWQARYLEEDQEIKMSERIKMLESLTFIILDLEDLVLIVIVNMKVVRLSCSSSS